MPKRDQTIDALRGFGALLLILAHIQAPYSIASLRAFDVPLMVFLSGVSFFLSTSQKTQPSFGLKFYKHRLLRLILPVYMFMPLYIGMLSVGELIHIVPAGYVTSYKIITTFLLLDGFGYVWVIRVFLLIMLISPFLWRIHSSIKSNILYGLIVASICILQCILLSFDIRFWNPIIAAIYNDWLLYLIGYSIFFMVGIRLYHWNSNIYSNIILISLLLILLGWAIFVKGQINVTFYKYPPHFPYIFYGTLISVLLWGNRSSLAKIFNNPLFCFCGMNSIWLYLWHIPFVLVANALIPYWILRFLSVSAFALLITYIQSRLAKKSSNKYIIKYFQG